MESLKEKHSGGWCDEGDRTPASSESPSVSSLEQLRRNWKVRLLILAMFALPLVAQHCGGFWLSLSALTSISLSMSPTQAATPKPPTLLPFVFQPLPLGSIKPSGWLRNEMQTSADGLAGHLHDFYRFVSQSPWLGGTQEYSALNEGFPYWFNAIVPLAYGLNDGRLKTQVHSAVMYVLKHQAEDGWIGPEEGTSRNFWARFPFFLGLTNLVDADPSYQKLALDALHKFNTLMNSMLRNGFEGYLYRDGDTVGSFDTSWGRVRMCDMLITLQWLLENDPRNASSTILSNMELLVEGQLDWTSWYVEGVYPTKDVSTLPISETQGNYWFQHGVNIGQGLKAGAVVRRLTNNETLVGEVKKAVEWNNKYHGAPSGVVLADERLEGLAPYYGSELCTVVETMYSMSYLYQALGDASYADLAESAAFNALPAMLTADHWAHQYVAEPNQPYAQNLAEGDPFYNVNPWGQTFGLEPNYPCCTVNHGQGLPKYVAAMFASVGTNGSAGLAHTLLGPARVQATLAGGNRVYVDCETNYPFDNILSYTISADKAFEFHIRVPKWANAADVSFTSDSQRYGSFATSLDGSTQMQKLSVPAGETRLVYTLPTGVSVEQRSNDTVAIRWGALLYALEVGSTNTTSQPKLYSDPNVTQAQETYPEQVKDYQLFNTTAWSVAIDPSTLEFVAGNASGKLAKPVFAPGAPPSKITAKGCEINWPLYLSVPAPAPLSEDRICIGKVKEYTLRPYGSTKIRMTELPTMDLAEYLEDAGRTHAA